jgi:hypothetical protein
MQRKEEYNFKDKLQLRDQLKSLTSTNDPLIFILNKLFLIYAVNNNNIINFYLILLFYL